MSISRLQWHAASFGTQELLRNAPGCSASAASLAEQVAGTAAHPNGVTGQGGHEDAMLLREYAAALECLFAEVFDVCMQSQPVHSL
jgi:hypothetical protein